MGRGPETITQALQRLPRRESLRPAQNTLRDTLGFTRVFPDPPIVLRTDLTSEHLRRIFEWENSVWTEGRPYSETTAQFSEELREARDIWINVLEGREDLADASTMHHLREEIGDGIIASVGIVRSVLERALNQDDRVRGGLQSRVSLYLLKGQRMVDRLSAYGQSDGRIDPSRRNDIVMTIGGAIKSGFVALERLGIGPGQVIDGKIATNRIKYSPTRLAEHGSLPEAKRDWNRRQLPVIERVLPIAA